MGTKNAANRAVGIGSLSRNVYSVDFSDFNQRLNTEETILQGDIDGNFLRFRQRPAPHFHRI